MKKEVRIGVSALASLVLAAAIWALPPAASDSNAAKSTASQAAAQSQSVSGKIASVEKTSFTLTVASDRMSSQSPERQRENPAKTMAFQVDKNTTIDGKLQVGANADVSYREEGGNNIAISVRVTP